MPKKVAGKPALDATMPNTSVKVKGKEFHLAFTFGSLSVAEKKLKSAGVHTNIFSAFDFSAVGPENLGILFFASLQASEPEITYEEVVSMITLRNAPAILAAVASAYMESMAEPDEDKQANPLMPQ